MSLKTVGNLRDEVSGILSGLNLSNVTNLYGAFERGARTLLQKCDIPEATGKDVLTLYSGVYDYPAPTSIFGGTLIDLRPQGDSRNIIDVVYRQPIELFDRTKALLPNGYSITFEYVKGVGRMRIAQVKTQQNTIIDSMTSDDNWTGGSVTIIEDETNFYQNPASLRFNVSSSGYIEKSLNSSIDMEKYEGVGVAFLAIYMPTVLTNIDLQIGSSSSNYITVSNTTGFLQSFTANEWQLVDFDFSTGVETGTVDWTKIKYVKIIFTGTSNNVRVGKLWASLPSPHEIIYQTDAIFMASGSNPSSKIVNDNDEIILNDSAFTLLTLECSIEVLLQTGGTLSSPMYQTINQRLHGIRGTNGAMIEIGLYEHYRGQNPSERLRVAGQWYE
mgnify:CR=1 FL=1